jgi:acetyl-CoA carboxylase biotin carboxylase subunit
MLSKVLIANRGEIACRIIRTCQRLGIRTVAVYSKADQQALHVQMADEAYYIGPPPAADSYLRIDHIVNAAKKAKADAIHPGYGFLSENPKFVEAVEAAGIVFVGPSADAMRRMGDKVAARWEAVAAGVPVIPGTDGEIEDTEAVAAAQQLGYPLMVKAADGGGGMGIRLVEREEELVTAIDRSRTQSQGAFGSSRIYLERHIDRASHVEIQVLADHHGNVVHLFERDCSVQRRNQKILEETPSPKINQSQREAMCDAAMRLAQHIGYTNAGTVEFLLAQDGQFYFLEANTRLQVEHPITEMVTCLDLVELQLRVAAGEKLPVKQSNIKQRGHALEARIYPEDPDSLLPTAGTVTELTEPEGEHVRVDGALYSGYTVLPHYESLMAKLIVWGEDRDQAMESMRQALQAYQIEGVMTNIPAIGRVLSHAAFTEGTYHTAFLEGLLNELVTASSGKEQVAVIAVAMALAQDKMARERPSRWKMHGRRAAMLARLSGGAP